MKILTEGHKYELSNFENKEAPGQVIQFIEKVPRSEHSSMSPANTDSKELITINDGTTNEEVLEMLIDRMKVLNNKVPSRESSIIITKLEEALMWAEKRTKDRIKRNVEGTREK